MKIKQLIEDILHAEHIIKKSLRRLVVISLTIFFFSFFIIVLIYLGAIEFEPEFDKNIIGIGCGTIASTPMLLFRNYDNNLKRKSVLNRMLKKAYILQNLNSIEEEEFKELKKKDLRFLQFNSKQPLEQMEKNNFENEIDQLRRKERKSTFLNIVVLFIFISIIIAFIFYTVDINREVRNEARVLENKKDTLEKVNKYLKEFAYEEITGEAIKASSVINDSVLYQMVLANAKIKYLDTLSDRSLRNDIIIRYYPKEVDGNVIFNLDQVGYYVHERPSLQKYKNIKSNILYYGADVDSTDIRLVALSMLKKGLPLKKIVPFPTGDWRNNAIQIEASMDVINERTLTVDDVVNNYK